MNYRHLSVIFLCVFIAGCFDLNQRFTLDEDNNATYEMQFLIAENIAHMAGGDPCKDMKLSGTPTLHIKKDSYKQGGNIVCSVSASGPIEEFQDLALKKGDNDAISITQLSPKLFRISSDYSELKEEKKDLDDNELAQGMISAMFANRAIRWNITSNKIVNSNGRITSDGKSVSWEIPLSALFLNEGNTDAVFYADVLLHEDHPLLTKTWHKILSCCRSKEDLSAIELGFNDAEQQKEAFTRLEAQREARKKQKEAETRLAFIKSQEDHLQEIEKDIIELENKKFNSSSVVEKLNKFEIVDSQFYLRKEKYLGDTPVIQLTVNNGTSHAISRAFFEGTIRTEGRSIPWLQEEFNFSISGGLEPGEEKTWKLDPGRYSEWGRVSLPEDYYFEIRVMDLYGPDGRSIVGEDVLFTEYDQEELDSLKTRYKEIEELIELYRNKE